MSLKHSQATIIHRINRWEHANAAARTGETVTADDLGMISWQQDDDSTWLLADTGPTWVAFGAGGDTGVQGDTGIQGDTGATGAQGDTGVAGAKGDTGDKGDTGAGTQGDTGIQGDTGADGGGGGYAFAYDFSTTITAPPTTGEIRFNNATIASVTTIWVHDTDRNSNDLDANLDQLVNGDAILISSEVDNDFASFDVTGNTDSGTYHTLTVTYVNASGGFANGEDISLAPAFQTGAQGDTGATGAKGDTGDQGDTGVTGAKGDTGADSTVQGDTGIQGDTGVKGDTGSGDQGDTGVKGDTGTGVSATGEIFLTAAGGWPSTTNGCATNTKNEYGTNDVDLYSLDFDGGSIEYAQWSVWMPDDWNGGTVTAEFIWTAPAGSGTVIWGLQGRSYANDEAIDQAWGTAQEATDTLIATNDFHFSPTTAAITLAGTPAAGEFVQLRAYRDGATDTHAVDAKLLGVKVYYTRS